MSKNHKLVFFNRRCQQMDADGADVTKILLTRATRSNNLQGSIESSPSLGLI
ncbi:hypothetical protein [Crinalium epipsammum]|uniref:hypothetical protein n=1 Tax=Crinalium epipsammum TaxID=241425 RepID=UPI00030CC23B|nr:hypothetical protein [Crinalium epipsammum]